MTDLFAATLPRRRPRALWIVLAAVAAIVLLGGVIVAVRMPHPPTALADPPEGTLTVDDDAQGFWYLGDYRVTLDDHLRVIHPDATVPVWQTPQGRSFVTAGVGDARFEDDYGLLRVQDRLTTQWADQRVESVTQGDDGTLTISGSFAEEQAPGWQVQLSVGEEGMLRVVATTEGKADRLYVTAGIREDEGVHGLGAQSVNWDLRGSRVPLIPREQGIGRGEQPLSFLVDMAESAAGSPDTTYLVSGVNVTDRARSMAYRGEDIASLDLRDDQRMTWEVWSNSAEFSLTAADTPADAVVQQASISGAAKAPPKWVSKGAIVGLQGGTQAVRDAVEGFREKDVPLAAVWLQDWVGSRTTDFGDRLQWNWTLNTERYPEWDELVAELREQGTRVLTYVNAYLSEDSGAAAGAMEDGRNLYAEAAEAGYLVVDAAGDVINADQHGFTAASVDLSNEDAREWFATVIAEEVAGVGASGWMADFAEGPPLGAKLAGGDGIDWRVRWPVLWQEVNNRALELADLEKNGLVWHRSGGTVSAGTADALWLGDQTQDWSAEDGLASTVTLTQNLSATGMAQVHGDIGGYTSIGIPVLPDVARDSELMLRWAEASILQPVFRTHEGNRPDASAQLAGNAFLSEQFADVTRLFTALGPERARLAKEDPLATSVQHPAFLSDDPMLREGGADDELQLGPDVLLAPALEPGQRTVDVVLPPGRWQHVWSGDVFGSEDAARSISVTSRLGHPALFVREDTRVAEELAAAVG